MKTGEFRGHLSNGRRQLNAICEVHVHIGLEGQEVICFGMMMAV